jgi:hypothetical protein
MAVTSSPTVPKSTVGIWFAFLQQALKAKVPINWAFYSNWGTAEELAGISFNRWWAQTGAQLFSSAAPMVKVISIDDDDVVISIPRSLRINAAKRQVAALLAEQKPAHRIQRGYGLKVTGAANYRILKRYERLLKVELDPTNIGLSAAERLKKLQRVYERIAQPRIKAKANLRAKGKRAHGSITKFVDPESLGSERDKNVSVNPKKISRWSASARHVLLNVAEGAFPGTAYHGLKLSARLKNRLKARSITLP